MHKNATIKSKSFVKVAALSSEASFFHICWGAIDIENRCVVTV